MSQSQWDNAIYADQATSHDLGTNMPLDYQWDIEAVVDKRLNWDKVEYLVKWQGVDHRNVPWKLWIRHREDLNEAMDAVRDFDNNDPDRNWSFHAHINDFNPFAKAYFEGNGTYLSVVQLVMEQEKNAVCWKGWSAALKQRTLLEIFAGMHRSIFETLIKGSLARRKYAEAEFAELLESYRHDYKVTDAGIRPSIYHFELIDAKGYGPNIAEAWELLNQIERYLDDAAYAQEIDDPNGVDTDSQSSQGSWWEDSEFHRYAFRDARNEIVKKRLEVFREFVEAGRDYLRRASNGSPTTCTDQMPQNYSEDGYAADVEKRLEGHLNEAGSNYIMVLMNQICRHDWLGRWQFRADVIFHCFDLSHARVAELAFTAISGAKSDSGHGVSHFEAGRSNSSNETITDIHTWTEFAKEKYERPAKHNLALELERLEALEEQTRQLEKRVADLQKEQRVLQHADLLGKIEDLELENRVSKMAEKYLD